MDDVRQAIRTLRRQPAFAAVAILTLAFGIGLNTTIFGLISAFFLQPLAVPESDRLVLVMQRGELLSVPYGHSYPDYLDYRDATSALSDLAAQMPAPAHVSAPGRTPERTWVEIVSPNYFTLARVRPAFGEFPRPNEAVGKGGAPTVVLSYRYWQRHFGGDPSLVGRPITINGKIFTVTGIAPESFTGLSWAMAVSAFVPAGAMGSFWDNGDDMRESRGSPMFRLMGRLAPGKTTEDARREFEVLAKRLSDAYPAEHKNSRVLLIPENRARPDPSVSDFLPVFAGVFAGMVGLVLLIACANVANLMLARAAQRQRDLVIRSALGASRFRLIRLQVCEAVVLALIAGAIALLLAEGAGAGLTAIVTPTGGDIPANTEQPADWRTYPFTFAVALFAGVLTGILPARRATRFDLVESLKDGSGGGAGYRHRFRNVLVVAQVTMSLVVLIGTGLFVHSLRKMQHVGLGFRPQGLVMMSVDLSLQQYGDRRGLQFLEDLLARAERLPGVESATVATHVPFDLGLQMNDVRPDREIPASKDGYASTAFSVVGPRFFETIGLTMLKGRAFDTTDTETSPRVAVVNESMARKFWPGEEAIGRRFRLRRDGPWVEVIGIAADGRYVMIGEEPRPYFYMPLAQDYRAPATLVARSAAKADALVIPLQQLVNDMDAHLPVYNVRTMEQHMKESPFALMPMRTAVTMAGVVGTIALLLAVIGLYAVVSYAVSRRTREIGIRISLGAEPRTILRLVLSEGMRLAAIGIVIGLIIATAAGLGLSTILFGVAPVDVLVLTTVTLLVLTVAALACYVPARRAMRIQPLTALRYE
jgi:predicted permease